MANHQIEKAPTLPLRKGANRGVDRQATREKADAGKDRELKYILWQRTSQTFADVKKISDDKDCKDREFGCNQRKHSYASARRKYPGAVPWKSALKEWCSRRPPHHSYFQSGSSGCLMSQSGRRLLTTGILAKLYSTGGELVDHSSVHASQGSFPAALPLK